LPHFANDRLHQYNNCSTETPQDQKPACAMPLNNWTAHYIAEVA
jgi:hypothetical protein